MITIQPQYLSLAKLVDGRLFLIPEYQRAYSWTSHQREDLFSDIEKTHGKGADEGHFMAAVVCLNRRKQVLGTDEFHVMEVVDGQQRLTTLIILLNAIRLALGKTKPETKLGAELEELLVKVEGDELLLLQTNHDSSHYFANYLRKGTAPESASAKTLADRELRACKESCVRNAVWVYPSTYFPYGDSRMDAILKLKAEQLASELATQAQTIDDVNGLLKMLMKSALERMLDTEMDVHLGRKGNAAPAGSAVPEDNLGSANRRNGHSKKTLRGELGPIPLDAPRDRQGTFEPQLIAKHQRRLAGFDEKILALYAKGLTTRDIQEIVKELYGVDVSPTLVSEITADLDAEVTAWRQRRLEPVWPIVYLDGIVVHVRGESGRVSQHTMHVAVGVNLQGKKELLGLWLSETEGAKFWLSCLTDLKNRGLQDLFIVCVDGLSGFAEAIRAAYPQAKVQLCIVHLVRAALKYVTTEDSRAVAADLKTIYQSATVEEAEAALEKFDTVWGAKYPTIVKQWRLKWNDIITLFEFPPAIRKAIYTTNVIESINSVIRKFTRNRKQYPNAESALKLIYLAIHEASKRWTLPIRGWKAALNHFAILFEDRLPGRKKDVA